jgi:hypothetical protein
MDLYLLIEQPASQARWADRLEEAAGRLEVEMADRCQVVTKLEALRILIALVWDPVLGDVDGTSSLVPSLSMVAELLEGPFCVCCRLVAFSRVEVLVGATWVRAKCGFD